MDFGIQGDFWIKNDKKIGGVAIRIVRIVTPPIFIVFKQTKRLLDYKVISPVILII